VISFGCVEKDASRPFQIGLMSCSILLRSTRNWKADLRCYPVLAFGNIFPGDMATDQNRGANVGGAKRISRQSNHVKRVGENVNHFAKNVAAVCGALDSNEFINATFRLLRAAAPGCSAWMMLRCCNSRGAICMSSNGLRVEDEIAKHFYRDYPGYRFLISIQEPSFCLLRAFCPKAKNY
jgi:hypothetical protein